MRLPALAYLPLRVVVGVAGAMAVIAQLAGLEQLAASAYAAGDPLEASVQRTGRLMRESWSTDPSTASLPFPSIDLLPAGTGAQKACSDPAPTHDQGSVGIYCAGNARVLLDRNLLELRVKSFGESAIAYWIATALAESLLSRRSDPSSLPPAAANLQANCLAGVFIGAAPSQMRAEMKKQLGPALSAYSSYQADRMGTRPQRAYALLTGIGATKASCSDADMQALANGRVPDPVVLASLEQFKDQRASSSLLAVMGSSCRPRPQAPCPRRINGLKLSASGK